MHTTTIWPLIHFVSSRKRRHISKMHLRFLPVAVLRARRPLNGDPSKAVDLSFLPWAAKPMCKTDG